MKQSTATEYCNRHSRFTPRVAGSLVTAQLEKPEGKHSLISKVVGTVSAAEARIIAECQPGGAIIQWADHGKTLARVYSRVNAQGK